MIQKSFIQSLSVSLLLSCMPIASLSAAPADGDTFLFIGSGNPTDYANDFQALVNNDPSLGITITAEGYSSSDLITDYYDGRYTDRAAIVAEPTLVNNALTSKLDEDFDYIVFFGDAYDLDDYPEQFLEEAHLLKDWIRWQNKSSKMVIAGVWNSTTSTRLAMNEKLYRIGDALEMAVAPANATWEDLISDPSVSVSNYALSSHTGEARYTLATSLYTHYFEHPTANSAFTLSGLSAAEKTAINKHAYNNWVIAQNTAQYTGEFIGGHCRPGQLTIGSGTKAVNSLAFGSSTEAAITNTMAAAYADAQTFQISRYWYDPNPSGNTYNTSSVDDIRFPYILYPDEYFLTNTSKETGPYYLAEKDYDFGLDRWNGSGDQTSSIHHQDFKALSKNPDIQFVGYWRHSGTETSSASTQLLNYDLTRISLGERICHSYTNTVRSAVGDPNYAHTLPVAVGFGRFIEERYKNAPYANDAPVYWGVHMGRYYESWMGSMLYILATGNKPAYKEAGWSRTAGGVTINAADWNFAIDQSYEVMMNHGSLKGANGEVMPTRANYAPLALAQSLNLDQDTASDITIPLLATDKESPTLSFTIVDTPAHGSVSISGSIVTYTPDGSYNSGSDDFTFQATDGALDSNIATVSITVGSFSAAPEMNILGNSNAILDGSTSAHPANFTSFDDVILGSAVSSTSRTFTLLNSGLADLDLTGAPLVSITGVDASDFSVTQQPVMDPIASTLSTTFEVTFTPASVGSKTAVLHIDSNDSDEAEFDFAISGIATEIALTFNASGFQEALADDGTIDSTPLLITLNDETLTGSDGRNLVADGHLVVSNLPNGLIATATKTSDTQVSVVLSGSVTYHEASLSISNLTFTFADAAFSTYPASGIINSTRSDLQVNYTGSIPYVGNANDSGPGSLRQVIAEAEAGSTVLFLPAVTSITLTSGQISLNKNISIDGLGNVLIDANANGRHFDIYSSSSSLIAVQLTGLTLQNGFNTADSLGGSIYNNEENLTIDNCAFNANILEYDGGRSNGGAIYSVKGNLIVSHSTFTGNQAKHLAVINTSGGGALYQSGGTLTVTDCIFDGNLVEGQSSDATNKNGEGGAISIGDNCTATITRTQIINNQATSVGSVSAKKGTANGGGVFLSKSILSMIDCILHSNTAGTVAGNGGGIYCYSTNQTTSLTLERCTLSNNVVAAKGASYGGAIAVNPSRDDRATVTLKNCTLSGNLAHSTGGSYGRGGAIYQTRATTGDNTSMGTVLIYNTTISNNQATSTNSTRGQGGALYLSKGEMTLNSVIIANNTAINSGQDIFLDAANFGTFTADYCLIESATDNHGLVNGVSNNIVGADPTLGPLADNGGLTLTHALLTGSPAIDAGANSQSLIYDQRGSGFDRVLNSLTDIGAFELLAAQGGFVVWAIDAGLTGDEAASDADPDGDGEANLLEYFVGSDPLSAGGIQINATIDGGDRLAISYQSDNAIEPSDVTVTIESSSDLGITDLWAPVAATHSVNGTGPYTHTWTQDQAIGLADKAFIRITLTD